MRTLEFCIVQKGFETLGSEADSYYYLHFSVIALFKAYIIIMAEENSKTESMDTGAGTELGEANEANVASVPDVIEDRKRKGPKLRGNPLKRQNSLPNIRQLGEVKKAMSFSDMLLVTFRDNSFVKGVVPILNDMMAPLIQNAIQSAVRSAVDDMKTSVLDKLIETNEALQKTVTDQSETITRQKALIDTQARKIDSKIAKVTELEREVQLLTDELDNMKMSLNDLEQYGRRNSLRINNLKLNYNGEESDLTRAVVNFVNSVVLIDDKD